MESLERKCPKCGNILSYMSKDHLRCIKCPYDSIGNTKAEPLTLEGLTAKGVNMNVGDTVLENNFMYHAPREGQQELRSRAKELAYLIKELVPASREQSLAITKLEEAISWANAGVARN